LELNTSIGLGPYGTQDILIVEMLHFSFVTETTILLLPNTLISIPTPTQMCSYANCKELFGGEAKSRFGD